MAETRSTMDKRFATEKIPKLLLSLAAPTIAAQLINALYNVVDRMYIARIPETGSLALTGVGLTFPIIIIVSAFAALIGMGGAPLASIRMGQGARDRANQLLGNCFVVLLGVAAVLTVLLLWLKTPVLRLFGASSNTLPYAEQYLSIYLLGTISVQISLGMNQFISAQGFAKTAMSTVFLGAGVNILLDPILIFGFGMGVRGAALATILSQTCSAVWVLCFITSSRGTLRLTPENMRVDWRLMARVATLGLSPFIMQSTESLVQVAFQSSLAAYGGDLYVGAMVIMSSIMQFFSMPLQGLAQGSQPIMGYNYGAGNYKRVKQTIKIATVICVSVGLTLWSIAFFLPQLPIALFTHDPVLAALTARVMPVFFFGFLIFGAQSSFQQTFVALGQAKSSIFIAVLRKLILLIPLVLLLPRVLPNPVFGVFLAEPISDICSALTCCILFAYRYRKLLCGNTQQTTEPNSD